MAGAKAGQKVKIGMSGNIALRACAQEIPEPALIISGSKFDYSTLDTAAAALARNAADKIRLRQREIVGEIFEVGADLRSVKEAIGHGSFGAWLGAEFGWSERTAQRYMQVAATLGEKSDTVSDLPAAVIYKLAAPSTPQGLRDDIVRHLERGDRLPASVIVNRIAEANDQERASRVEAGLTAGQRRYRAKTKSARERERQRFEVDKRQRLERAQSVAEQLIDDLGAARVKRILDAADDWDVRDALQLLLQNDRGAA